MNQDQFYSTIKDSYEAAGYNQDKIQFISRHVGINKKILDIGCNDGFIGSILIQRQNQVYGIDISSKKVKKALSQGVHAKVHDIERKPLPYGRDSFDVVLLTDVIEHIFDTDRLLVEIRRILKKDGSLILTTPNIGSFGRRLLLLFGRNPFLEYSLQYLDQKHPPVGHIRYYLPYTLLSQLSRLRYKDIRLYGDRVNFGFVSSKSIAKLYPNFSVDILCICKK